MKGFIKFIGVLILVVALLVGGVYAAISVPKKVKTKWTEKDLLSYQEKTHSAAVFANGQPANLEDLLFNNFKTSGQIPVEGYLTASEITAMVNNVTRGQGLFENAAFAFNDDGTMEASGVIGAQVTELVQLFPELKKYEEYIALAEGKPIYWKYSLERINSTTFGGHTEELRVGQVPLPVSVVGGGLSDAGSAINNMVKKLDGFSCDEFYIDGKGMHFKGTIPERIEYIDKNNLPEKN